MYAIRSYYDREVVGRIGLRSMADSTTSGISAVDVSGASRCGPVAIHINTVSCGIVVTASSDIAVTVVAVRRSRFMTRTTGVGGDVSTASLIVGGAHGPASTAGDAAPLAMADIAAR